MTDELRALLDEMAIMAMNAARDRIKALDAENERLHKQIQELQEPESCSVCAGMGTLTGKLCICGNMGTRDEEMVGLRKYILELEAENEKLKQDKEIQNIKQEIEDAYKEGFNEDRTKRDHNRDDDDVAWESSKAKKALEK